MSNSEKLYSAFSEALNIEMKDVNDELQYQNIPQWDSVSHMVLISTIEDKFGVSLDTDEVIDLSSVGMAKELLKKHNITF